MHCHVGKCQRGVISRNFNFEINVHELFPLYLILQQNTCFKMTYICTGLFLLKRDGILHGLNSHLNWEPFHKIMGNTISWSLSVLPV